MEIITDALKIIDNSTSNIKNAYFHEESFIYMKTNERIQDYINYLLNKKHILSVIGSGDQILNTAITSPQVIDCFDISVYPEYFINLKLAAIKTLSKEEYLDMFFESALTTKDEYYDDLYFDKIRSELPKKYQEFWNSLLNHTDWYEITNSSLFSSEVVTRDYAKKQNLYLSDAVYNTLKDKIAQIEFNFYVGNILDIYKTFSQEYDLIFLSNILAYVDRSKYRDMLNYFNLSQDGYILTYLFGNLQENEKFFHNPKVKIKEFDNSDNVIMIYHK